MLDEYQKITRDNMKKVCLLEAILNWAFFEFQIWLWIMVQRVGGFGKEALI